MFAIFYKENNKVVISSKFSRFLRLCEKND
jgi:hypothetical protein